MVVLLLAYIALGALPPFEPPPLTEHGCFAATPAGDAVYCVSTYRYGDHTVEALLVRLLPRSGAHRVRAQRTLLYEGAAPADPKAREKLVRRLGKLGPGLTAGALVALTPGEGEGRAAAWASPDGASALEVQDSWDVMRAVAYRSAAPNEKATIRLAGDPDAPWKVSRVWWVPGSRTFVLEVLWKPEKPDPEFQLETGIFFIRAPGDGPPAGD